MKKAIKINLGGLIFHIDEDAYDKLKSYLSTLMNQFGNNEEAKEIVSDIESRIAELFQNRLSQGKEVINFADVQEVITVMGNPKDYDTESATTEEKAEYNQDTSYTETKHRRFYRDRDHSVLGGVCSGLGAYFGMDPVIFRIVFIALLFTWGAAIPLYIILWIALPEAKTAAQKLEMRGEPVNVSNIEKKVKEEFDQVKKNFKRIDPEKKARNIFESILHLVITIIKGIFKVIAVILGSVFVIVGIILISIFIGLIFGKPVFNGHNAHFGDLSFAISQFAGTGMHWLVITLAIVMCAIPVVAILYMGLKLIFKFKTKDKYFWIGAATLWIGSIIAFVLITVNVVKDVTEYSIKTTTFNIESKAYKTIYLTANSESEVKKTNNILSLHADNEDLEYFKDEEDNLYGRPRLVIEKCDSATGYVSVERKAHGSNNFKANINAQNIQYDIFQKDSMIVIDPYFVLKPDSKWRAQQLLLTIYIPVGSRVSIDKNLEDMLKDANIDGTYWIHELPGKVWVMTEKGLREVE